MEFDHKDDARHWVWETLRDESEARFPYPIEGRIPNFDGAERAADRLLETDLLEAAETIKVNPDSPQKHLRERALRRGITVFVPTPRLKSGFMAFEPDDIPDEHLRDASMLSRWDRWAREVPLEEIPRFDAIVVGSVAVTRGGARCGKGEGYSDLEYGILRELGHPHVPVATTVHEIQVVEGLPTEAHDLGLTAIATPEATHRVDAPLDGPDGIDWSLLNGGDLEEMPLLKRLR